MTIPETGDLGARLSDLPAEVPAPGRTVREMTRPAAIYVVYPAQARNSGLSDRMPRAEADKLARTASEADPSRSYWVMDFRVAVAEYLAGNLRACHVHAPLSMSGHMTGNLRTAIRSARADLDMFERGNWPLGFRGEYIADYASGQACCIVAGYAKSLMHTAFRQLLAGES